MVLICQTSLADNVNNQKKKPDQDSNEGTK